LRWLATWCYDLFRVKLGVGVKYNLDYAEPIRAVSGVDLTLVKGEVLALLGESGSGKTVTLRALMRLLPAKRSRIGGEVRVDGRDVLAMAPKELAAMRGPVVSMIFQEPGIALDPVYRLGNLPRGFRRFHSSVLERNLRSSELHLFEDFR